MDLATESERRKFISDGIDKLVPADGRGGRIRQLVDSGHPVVLLTHWQSLYTQGTGLGLGGLSNGTFCSAVPDTCGHFTESRNLWPFLSTTASTM